MAGRGRGATLPAWMTTGATVPQSSSQQSLEDAAQQAQQPGDRFEDSRNDPATDDRDYRQRGGRDDQQGASHRGRDYHGDRGDRGDRDSRRRRSRSRSRSRSPRSQSNSRDNRRSNGKEKEEPSVAGWKPRRNKSSNFDVLPPAQASHQGGFDSVPAPAMPKINVAQPSYFSFPNQPILPPAADANSALTRVDTSVHTKHARRIYAGGIPPTVQENELIMFFNDVVTSLLAPQRCVGPPCIKSYINREKCYAFVEFMSIELATACMQLDGIKFEHPTGATVLRIRRPNDYRPELLPPPGKIPEFNQQLLGQLGATSSSVGKLFVGGLPYHLEDNQVIELLSAFGPLKSFHQVREPGSNMSKGYAFTEYENIANAEMAIKGLNGMPLGDKTLTVRFAVPSSNTPSSSQPASSMMATMGANMITGGHAGAFPMVGGMGYAPALPLGAGPSQLSTAPPTRVLKLCNMLTEEDLYNEAEYEDIKEDVRLECQEYGAVRSLIIPRARDGFPKAAEGLIFVEFVDAALARKAALALHGRKFADKTVVVTYFDEEKFAARILV